MDFRSPLNSLVLWDRIRPYLVEIILSVSNLAQHTRLSVEEILIDYRTCLLSRHTALLGRKEVFMGKAKFGIFGDGKEVAQVAMAKAFMNGDIRSGYYRDMTFMFAIGQLTVQQFFAQIYAHADVNHDPFSGGRQMNSHFATRILNEKGERKTMTDMKVTTSDVSCTAGQIARTLGLGYASKLYRNNPALNDCQDFSINGNEVTFSTIGNASTSEGHFLEAINAAGVLQVPIIYSVWDDYFGISVPNEYHTTKSDISKVLAGFQRTEDEAGLDIYKVNGWDYAELCKVYAMAAYHARKEHVPSLVHVDEMTQPLGHSTSGSHERYKSEERLQWEKDFDCIKKMKEWILEGEFSTEAQLNKLEEEVLAEVKEGKTKAWREYTASVNTYLNSAKPLMNDLIENSVSKERLLNLNKELNALTTPLKSDVVKIVKKTLRIIRFENSIYKRNLIDWLNSSYRDFSLQYNSHLYSESALAAHKIKGVQPVYSDSSKEVDGREVITACFDKLFEREKTLFAIGEDLGKIGDVNQGFAGLQSKYGEIRITDTGIRETTIVGQGVGAALRGLKPVVEIQYLDYIYYALETLTDDLACLHYRTKGGQKAPIIVRTRGHRLEGIWHSGSPMGTLLGSIRGIYLLVPRDMTQAAGFYNTMLESDDSAIVIETLNGYRRKELMPDNVGEIRLPLGLPEVLREGNDVTIVTYGAMCRIVNEAATQLDRLGISCEVIDIQSLLPFDTHGVIVSSLKKTNKIVFADEDVPGGASAYMMQQVIERDGGYSHLDAKPVTISAKAHRPAYGSDGDYFSKPNVEDVVDKVYELISETDPTNFPDLY